MLDDFSRKAVYFDLDDKRLKTFFKDTRNPYGLIKKFFIDNGFQHRQLSGYHSIDLMTYFQILELMTELSRKLPWLKDCVNKIDVTNIGDEFDLLKIVKSVKVDIEPNKNFDTEKKPSILGKLKQNKEAIKDRATPVEKQPKAPER